MKRACDVISGLFDEGLIKKAENYSALFSCWKDLMEKNNISAAQDYSRIQSMERGLVWIEVDHPGWKQILQTKEAKLLSDFRIRFPEMDISGISIVLSRNKTIPKKEASVQIKQETTSGKPEIEEPASVIDDVKDKALKAVLMRLEKNIAERERSV